MKAKLKKIGIYIVIGLFGLGFIILRAGLENDNSAFSFTGTILMSIIGILALIYFIVRRANAKTAARNWNSSIELLKKNSKKIKVDLEQVEVKTNTWQDTVVISESKYGGLDEMRGYNNSNLMQIDRNVNSLNIAIPYEGKVINYLVNIEKDPTVLAIQFAIQKETYLYIENKPDGDIYLDLEFLD